MINAIMELTAEVRRIADMLEGIIGHGGDSLTISGDLHTYEENFDQLPEYMLKTEALRAEISNDE